LGTSDSGGFVDRNTREEALTELASAEGDDMYRIGIREHLATSDSGKNAIGHVEWFTADPIRFKDSRTEVVYETQRRYDQSRGARKLGSAVWRWIIPRG
jgi:hypothetical protein